MNSRPDDAAEQPADGAPETVGAGSAESAAALDAEPLGSTSSADGTSPEPHGSTPSADGTSPEPRGSTPSADGTSPEPHASDASDPSADDRSPDAAAPIEHPVLVDRDDVQVHARLVPRYGRFMVLGAIVGAVGGWLWSRLGSSGPWLGAGPDIDTSAVVPFIVGVGVLAGIVLGAVVAIVLDRLVGRRRRTLTAERTRHHRDH